jgi:hypothetical protein
VVLVQKWMHDAAAFEALAIEEQEKVIGRTKKTSTELAEEVRGAASHVSRTVIEEHGVEQHIFRRNTPFGTATEPSGSVAKSCPVVTYSKSKQERMTQERTFQEPSVCLIPLPNPSALSRTPSAMNLHASATHPVNVSVAINEQSLCSPLRREQP